MTRDIIDRLEMFGSSVKVIRCALNMDQVDFYNPPPNPAKVTDSRFASYQELYGSESWELDALEPQVLEGIVRSRVEEYLDAEEWDLCVAKEQKVKGRLQAIATDWEAVFYAEDMWRSDK